MLQGIKPIIDAFYSVDSPSNLVPFVLYDGNRNVINYGYQDVNIIPWGRQVTNKAIDCVITLEAIKNGDAEDIYLCVHQELITRLNFWRKFE